VHDRPYVSENFPRTDGIVEALLSEGKLASQLLRVDVLERETASIPATFAMAHVREQVRKKDAPSELAATYSEAAMAASEAE
jgi:hypothetical protein